MVSTANDYYGHKHVLARYAGIEPTPMLGYLQHGWSRWRPFPKQYGSYVGGVPKLVWTEKDADWCREEGLKPVRAVGAPFLYLREMRKPVADPEPDTLVAFPHHSFDWSEISGNWEGYADGLNELGYGKVTVCLHPFDHAMPDRRGVFEERGFDVVTNGERTDPAFLERMFSLLERNSAATTNRVATSLFYAASLGRRVFLYGPLMTISRTKDPEGHDDSIIYEDLHARVFPELAEGIEGDQAIALGDRELGADSLLSPDELRRAVGWRGGRRAAARGLAAVTSARRRLRRLD